MQIDVSVEVVNPTTTNLSIPGKMINIKKIDFSTPSGKYLGTAFPNVNNIALPANSKQVIPNIPVQVAISDALSNFMEVIEVFSDTSKLRITTTIEAFGKEFTIN